MSRAKQLIQESAKDDILGAADNIEWRDAVQDVLESSEDLYMRLKKDGVIDLVKKHRSRNFAGMRYNERAVAEAILRITIERRRGSPAAAGAYKLIKKWANL